MTLDTKKTPRRSVELSCLCFLGDHYYYHLITCWTLYKHGLFIGFPCIGFVALEDLFCPSFNFCELHESMCGMFLIKERQETYEPRRNVNASFISLIIFHVSFQVMVFHWCLFWCSKLKAQRRERRKTGAKADHTSEAEDAMDAMDAMAPFWGSSFCQVWSTSKRAKGAKGLFARKVTRSFYWASNREGRKGRGLPKVVPQFWTH